MSVDKRKYAKALIKKGLDIFPVESNGKKPAVDGWQGIAKRGDDKPWANGVDHNIGVACGGRLVIIDIDMKNGVDGEATWAALMDEHNIEESPFQVKTPSEGRHIYYLVPDGETVNNSVGKLGPGVDVRGRGGYVVGPGSIIDGKAYKVITTGQEIIKAGPELMALLGRGRSRADDADVLPTGLELDRPENVQRARDYLAEGAEVAVEGAGGDQTTFSVAARVREMGIARETCTDLMAEVWNDRCSPPWSADDLERKVQNAYLYATGRIGGGTAEADFEDDPDSEIDLEELEARAERIRARRSPVDKMNDRYAFVAVGTSHVVLEEYLDDEDQMRVALYGEKTFHGMTVGNTYIDADGKRRYVSRDWIVSPERRTYRGFTFDPSRVGPVNGKYNHWRGFTYDAVAGMTVDQAKAGCALFLKHVRDVICSGDMATYRWMINYFAHLIQFPAKKPETAIVVVGEKGAGKSMMFDVVGNLVRDNYVITADKRMMLGNFNSHMENALLFQFEEAFWAGDKNAEGKLKLIVTGKYNLIERKGYEPYMVPNFARIGITSNNDWVVPASVDERRWTVVRCSGARRGDKPYFKAIYDQLESGGYEALMTLLSLLEVDKLSVHVPPKTAGLAEQKLESMECVARWIYNSLDNGKLEDVEGTGLRNVPVAEAYEGYLLFHKRQGYRYPKDGRGFGREVAKILGNSVSKRRLGTKMERVWTYSLKPLSECRAAFEEWFGHEIVWEEEVSTNQ
jgi:hypothetical protein